jgi:hypothetical protein
MRQPNTEKQFYYHQIEEQACGVFKSYCKAAKVELDTVPLLITKAVPTGKTAIITHTPVDLLAHAKFHELHLLESHTGNLKDRSQWYTKYHDGKNLPPMPFMLALLKIFGDGVHYKPQPVSVRKQIIEIAERYRWSATTTTDKISFSVSQIKDHALRHVLQETLI